MSGENSHIDVFRLALRNVKPDCDLKTELSRLEDVALHLYDGLSGLRVKLIWQEMQEQGVTRD